MSIRLKPDELYVKVTQNVEVLMPFRVVCAHAGVRVLNLAGTNVIGLRGTAEQLERVRDRVIDYRSQVPLKGRPFKAAAQMRTLNAVEARISLTIANSRLEATSEPG